MASTTYFWGSFLSERTVPGYDLSYGRRSSSSKGLVFKRKCKNRAMYVIEDKMSDLALGPKVLGVDESEPGCMQVFTEGIQTLESEPAEVTMDFAVKMKNLALSIVRAGYSHGDLNPANLGRRKFYPDRIVALDWESAKPQESKTEQEVYNNARQELLSFMASRGGMKGTALTKGIGLPLKLLMDEAAAKGLKRPVGKREADALRARRTLVQRRDKTLFDRFAKSQPVLIFKRMSNRYGWTSIDDMLARGVVDTE